MELIKNLHENEFDDTQMAGSVYFKYLGDYIDLRFDKDIPMEYVEKTAEKLNTVTEEIMNTLFERSVIYCRSKLDMQPSLKRRIKLDKFSKPSDIMKYMEIDGLIVNLPEDMSQVAINLEGSCDWEEEDGIQWLIRDDAVVYVGPWADIDIWYSKAFEETLCNYAGEDYL